MPICYSSDPEISTEAATVPVISDIPHILLTKTLSLLTVALFDSKILFIYIDYPAFFSM